MEKYSNFDNEMEARSHFKNVVYLKNQMRRGIFRITQMPFRLGKIAMIIIITFIASVATADAQQKNFTDVYMELRQPKVGEKILFEKLNKKGIRKLLTAPEPKGQTEKERQEYLRGKAMLKNAKQINVVLDMEEQGGLISSQISDLFSPYEELISIKMEDMRVLISGVLTKKDKVKELIVFMSDTEDDVVLFANFLFKKPITFQDYIEKPGDIRHLFSVNSSDKENDNALFKISKSKTKNASPASPEFDITLPLTFKVVQVDGKYGVTPSPWKSKYLIKPTYEIEPVIYGSNPGNTYVATFDHNGYCYIHDKFGFTIAHGHELFPVYVIGNEDEVAAFIIRDEYGYSLYECPETYTLKQQNEENRVSLRPHIQRRILNCQSILLMEDGLLKCVNADGSIEFIQIRKHTSNYHQAGLQKQ